MVAASRIRRVHSLRKFQLVGAPQWREKELPPMAVMMLFPGEWSNLKGSSDRAQGSVKPLRSPNQGSRHRFRLTHAQRCRAVGSVRSD